MRPTAELVDGHEPVAGDAGAFRTSSAATSMPTSSRERQRADAGSAQPHVFPSRTNVRMMLHQVVRHKDIGERAFLISQSPVSTDADQNWLRAEWELLQVPLA